MRSKLPLLPSGPGGVRKSAFHGPWQNRRAIKPERDGASNQILGWEAGWKNSSSFLHRFVTRSKDNRIKPYEKTVVCRAGLPFRLPVLPLCRQSGGDFRVHGE